MVRWPTLGIMYSMLLESYRGNCSREFRSVVGVVLCNDLVAFWPFTGSAFARSSSLLRLLLIPLPPANVSLLMHFWLYFSRFPLLIGSALPARNLFYVLGYFLRRKKNSLCSLPDHRISFLQLIKRKFFSQYCWTDCILCQRTRFFCTGSTNIKLEICNATYTLFVRILEFLVFTLVGEWSQYFSFSFLDLEDTLLFTVLQCSFVCIV